MFFVVQLFTVDIRQLFIITEVFVTRARDEAVGLQSRL